MPAAASQVEQYLRARVNTNPGLAACQRARRRGAPPPRPTFPFPPTAAGAVARGVSAAVWAGPLQSSRGHGSLASADGVAPKLRFFQAWVRPGAAFRANKP